MSTTKSMSFEERVQRLQEIVSKLESGTLPLEDSVSLYKEGVGLGTACRDQLDKARHDVRILSEGELKAFDPETEQESEHA